ncbi:MAG: hypothetical protein ACJ8AD_09205, partial [Gemmatimonadaceae bacterium]
SRRLLGRRVRGQAARRSSSGLSGRRRPPPSPTRVVAFYLAEGAVPLNTYWYVWDDIDVTLGRND